MADSAALQEFHEIHEYIRHSLSIYVTWFTFFLVFMFGAMAWTLRAAVDEEGYVVVVAPFLAVVLFFAVQLAFGIWITRAMRADLASMDTRAQALIQAVAQAESPSSQTGKHQPLSSVPKSLHLAYKLMQWVLVSQLIFWLTVGVFVGISQCQGWQVFGSVASSTSDTSLQATAYHSGRIRKLPLARRPDCRGNTQPAHKAVAAAWTAVNRP